MDELTSLVRECEKKIIGNIKDFNKLAGMTAEKLSINVRDLMAVSTLGSVGSPTLAKKPERKEKRGLFAGVARFFGSLFSQDDWGYEKVTVTDVEGTRKNALEYLSKADRAYSASVMRWSKSAEKMLRKIEDKLDLEYEAYQARLNDSVKAAEKKQLLEMLKKIADGIPRNKIVKAVRQKTEPREAEYAPKTERIQISPAAFLIYRYAREMIKDIHCAVLSSVMRQFPKAERSVLAAWDVFSASAYLNRCFGVDISADELDMHSGELLNAGTVNVFMNPCKSEMPKLAFRKRQNVFLLVNALQIGQAEKQIYDSGMGAFLCGNCNAFLVVQNFTEVINSGEIFNTICSVLNIPKRLNLDFSPFLLINDANPVFSFAAAEAQFSENLNVQDETVIIAGIRSAMPAFGGVETEKKCAEIIKAVFGYRKGW